jgi:transcriptional regulator with XRE-family HTH domain
MADWVKRLHNCERQPVCPVCGGEKSRVAKRCQRCATAAQTEHIDRTPVMCQHPVAQHQHGEYATYVLDGCRCWPCTQAQHKYEAERKRAHAYGRWDGWVDAERVREHVRGLLAQGMGGKRIMAVGNVSSGTWTKLMFGVEGRPPSKRTRRDVAERILAIEYDPADGARVSSLGATRRLRALVALGWSQQKLAERLGILPGNATALFKGRGDISVRRDRQVRALYDELSMTLPPATTQRERISVSRARNFAKANGWLPPLAWDDEQMDDASYQPTRAKPESRGLDHAVVERFIASGERPEGRRLSHAESAEIARRLRRLGVSTHEMENRYGLKPERYKEGRTA